MTDQQIYVLMAETPNIRAVQIADALDQELVAVSAALRSLVEVGDVVKHSGTGPNGAPAQMYNLSQTFKKSREGVALLAAVGPGPESTPAAGPAPVPEPAAASTPSASFPTPVFAQQGELKPERSKVDMAIDHLTVHKSATDAELRTVMGLANGIAPKAYLTSAIRSGRVAKGEDGWTLGDGTPPPAPNQKPKHRDLNPPETHKESTLMPSTTPCTAPAGATAKPVFRCGLWSDGMLELQRNGQQVAALTRHEGEQQVAALTRHEGEQLVDFMGRMLGQAAQVAAR